MVLALSMLATAALAAPGNSTSPIGDACAVIAGKPTASYTDAKACLDSFPYKNETASQTLDTVLKVARHLYAFNEIAASPPVVQGLSVVPVDIAYGLSVIQHDNWKSDREFQEAVALLLDKVHDAHLSYVPYCYRQFVFWQPIQLNALVRNSKTVINVAYVKNNIWPEAKESWVGCQVTKIDDMDALDMVANYAVNNNGESKDVNTCFNNIMNTKSYFHGWDDGADDLGYHRFLPDQEMHSYTLQCPKNGTKPADEQYDTPFTVQVPWVAQVPANFHDAASYWSNYCQSSHEHITKRGHVDLDIEELQRIHDDQFFDLVADNAMSATDGGAVGAGNAQGSYVEFKALNESGVGVVDIRSFSIDSEDRQAFIDTFTQGLDNFHANGIKKIILDLSSNGGGDACAGEFIINTLTGPTPDYPSDIKHTPLMSRVVQKAMSVNDSKWLDYKTVNSTGTDWFSHTNTYTRGKQQVQFFQPITLSCDRWSGELQIPTNKSYPWTPRDIMILSDGRCGSTCAIVASRLHISHNVTTMGLGGIPGNRMQFASFPGGESYRLSTFLLDLQRLGLQNDTDAPAPFPQRADMGYTFREVYRPTAVGENLGKETQLLEYSVNYADCRLYFDDETADDVEKLWAAAAKVFVSGQCQPPKI
ncbi:hypothetical protein DM01DRAFT_1334507 [Hesseltinella vesiculosa]|uniref:Uncharacterized protein n=1 Tax=Hesseltinella vesiculosa TaxID=101127 RepID=A0A1X2GM54_9FUNG|nr:hypothetical protein DM01DRAFT_1334507 [Hesseltinella vesiculosa]